MTDTAESIDPAQLLFAGDAANPHGAYDTLRQQCPVADPEHGAGRRLEHAALRVDQQRLVGAPLTGKACGEHVGGVRQRLHPVEYERRRVDDGPKPDRPVVARQRLGDEESPAATREDDPQNLPARFSGSSGQETVRFGADGLEIDRQPEILRRAGQTLHVRFEGKRTAVVEPKRLKDAVAAEQPLV